MKNRLLTIVLLLILIGFFVFLGNLIFRGLNSQKLTSPDGKTTVQNITSQIITPSPTITPIEYHFDKSTDLKKELDTINPEVLDIDFNPLKNLISQF